MSDSNEQTTLGAMTVAEGSAPDPLAGLNDAQRRAVTHLGGPLLIVAGAGSGKTRTLTRRFEWLVSQGVQLDRVLALTYTNDAAAELIERIEQAIPDAPDEVDAMTFHALCMDVLRDEAAAANLNPFFTIATEPDRIAIMLARQNEISFEQTQVRGNPAAALGELIGLIDRLKEECVGPEQLHQFGEARLADAVEQEDRDAALKLIEHARHYAQHEQFLREAGAVDFGGLQFSLYKLLSSDEDVRRRVARRWDHVLVDEFQDTSYVQLEILKLLVQDHRNIAAVGDDDQSIYRFRGASPRSILDFEKRFGPATEVALELNYRSAPQIIEAARAIVGLIDEGRRRPKTLRAAEQNADGEVLFWHAASEIGETQAIVTEIERLIADAGVQPREICILASKHAHLDNVAARLRAHEIPIQRSSSDFFQRAEIRVPLSWLKVLADPTLSEDAWRMLIAHPIGVNGGEYAQLMRWMRKQKHPHVIDAVRSCQRSRQFSPETIDKLRHFTTTFDALAAQMNEMPPGEFMIRLINEISIKGAVLVEYDRGAPDRFANLSKLQRLADEYGARLPQATARDFAVYMTAMVDAGLKEASEVAETDPNAVRLLTAHSSKGLEFDYVFVPAMIEKNWPGRRQPGAKVPEPLLKDPMPPLPGKNPEREAHIEETRRLMHVAMTRARRQLVLSWFDAGQDLVGRPTKVSRFFEEARVAVGGQVQEFAERDFETNDFVYAEIEALRGELLRGVDATGANLGEMRLDAAGGAPEELAKFGELIKLSALTHRLRHGQTIADALPELNAMLEASMSGAQIAAYRASDLDERLTMSEQRVRELGKVLEGHSPELANYLPTVGNRLRLSASAISSYQRCPKQYEYENVLRIPTAEQSHLRLGIAVHNVLERFHKEGTAGMDEDAAREKLIDLMRQQIQTGGWGRTDDDRQLLARARAMLEGYAASEFSRPEGSVRTEVKFSLNLPPTEKMRATPIAGRTLDGIQINGKIDRIDTLPDGTQRVVDYKTGNDKKKPSELRNQVAKEVQLAIYKYAGASELGIDAEGLVYYFLENDQPVIEAEATQEHVDEVRATIDDVADKIISLDFTPKPEHMKCQTCAFSHVCPATEA